MQKAGIDPPSLETQKTFYSLWAMQLVLLLAASGSALVLALTMYERTGSVFNLSLLTGISTAVSIYLAPFAGSVIDKFSRRAVLIGGTAASAGSAGYLSACLFHRWGMRELFLGVFFSALSSMVVSLSMQASVRYFRKEADLTRVNGFTSAVENAPMIAGPLIGALIYSLTEPAYALVAEAACAAAAAVIMSMLTWPTMPRSPSQTRYFHRIRQGFSFIRESRDLLRVQLGFVIINCANGFAVSSVVAYVLSEGSRANLQAAKGGGQSSFYLAASNISGAIGLLAGASLVVAAVTQSNRRLVILVGIGAGAVFGRLLLPASFAQPSYVAVAWICLSFFIRNLGVQLSNAPLSAIWQERTPLEIQGSVFGARRLIGQGLYPIAIMTGGMVADGLKSAQFTPSGSETPALIIIILLAGSVEVFACVAMMLDKSLRRVSEPYLS